MWNWLKNFVEQRNADPRAVVLHVDDIGVMMEHLSPPARHSFRWADVDAIETFKLDLFTVDEIRLVFNVGENIYELGEGYGNFQSLMVAMKKHFPTIPEDWYYAVMFPPFATNQRTLCRRKSVVRSP